MRQIFEYEEKFFCNNIKPFLSFIKNDLRFEFKAKLYEEDTYLQDKNGVYISNLSCLRLRKSNNKYLELTAKYACSNDIRLKKEKNISLPLQKEKRIYQLLNRIGFSKYCTVFKERFIYTAKKNNITYNVMIDTINEKYHFVEFEIVSDKYHESFKNKLDEFINLFKNFDLVKTNENYRDFVKNIKNN